LEVGELIVLIFDRLRIKYADEHTTSVNKAMEEEAVRRVEIV